MDTVRWMISTAPEIFLLLSIALGTVLGRVRIRGFSIGTTACTLMVAVLIGQLGTFTFPSLLRVHSVQPVRVHDRLPVRPRILRLAEHPDPGAGRMALVLGGTGLDPRSDICLHVFELDPGTASGLAAGALTQSSIIGTASGALAQLGLAKEVLKQQDANIAAGYAVTYVLGYILTLLYVPFVAPKLMGIDLKAEAAKLEAELSGGNPPQN